MDLHNFQTIIRINFSHLIMDTSNLFKICSYLLRDCSQRGSLHFL